MHYNALFLYETWDIVRRIVLRYAQKSVTQRSTEIHRGAQRFTEKYKENSRSIDLFSQLSGFFGHHQCNALARVTVCPLAPSVERSGHLVC
jgi:hypothetical protein